MSLRWSTLKYQVRGLDVAVDHAPGVRVLKPVGDPGEGVSDVGVVTEVGFVAAE
jgi:hypothetical protein